MAAANFATNIYLWIGTTFLFMILFLFMMIFLIVISKKTHAILELKAWMKGAPICLFFMENRYCEWKPIVPDAGIITDKDYGAYIINERASYVDRRTKNILIPFDASVGASINIHAAKLVDDLQYLAQDEEEMKKLRTALTNNLIDDTETVSSLKTSIHFGAIKNMLTALIPHNINAKIEKTIAQRMKGYGKINIPQILLIFAGMLGAILLGALIIKLAFGK